jgi:NTP pyrophosphatase (non-canonical NTP hydrolase)
LTDAIKRHLIYGKDLDVVNVKEEVADMLWYTAAFCHTFKLKLLAPSIREYNQADRHLQDLVVSIAALGQVSDHVQAQVLCQQIYNSAASILAMYNIDMADALHSNIEKLAKRYGDKYSDFAALNRDVQAEREVLEANH